MDYTDLCYLPATELATLIRRQEILPAEVCEAFLARIDQINPILNAYCTVTPDVAREQARAVERAILAGDPVGPLAGVPVSIKDLLVTKGIRTTRGSLLYENTVPDEDAPVVERLRQAGAILLGKTNTPEFGWKGATDNRIFGATRNPWNLDRIAGGSSGGAGVAVAAGLGPLAIGTDGGGSIRGPASHCGIFGLKPTYGLVPAYPPSFAEALSHTGPMTRTVRDAALMLNVIAGYDARDRNSFPGRPADYLDEIDEGVAGMRVAWSPNLGRGLVSREIVAAAERAAKLFEDLGAHVEEATPDVEEYARPWLVLFYAAISAGIATYPSGWEAKLDPGLLETVRQMQGITGLELAQAHQTQARVYAALRRFFGRYDLLLAPTSAVPAWPIGQNFADAVDGQKVSRQEIAQLTQLFNLTGQPAATVPCGWSADGLPLGLQIVGRRHHDATVLRAAAAYETAAPWAQRRPVL